MRRPNECCHGLFSERPESGSQPLCEGTSVENRSRPGRSLRILGVTAALMVCNAVSLAQEAAPVSIAQPDVGSAQEVLTLTGTVTSARSAELSARVSGLVKRVLVDAGSRVESGALLIELDDEMARLELERSAAEVTEGRIRLDDAKRRYNEVLRLCLLYTSPSPRDS